MKVEIDQSGKVEYTSHKTVIADSMGNSVKISSKDKQILLQEYRNNGIPRNYTLGVFCKRIGINISSEQIDFSFIGKKSNAHYHANRVFKDKVFKPMEKKIHTTVTYEDVLKIGKIKKPGFLGVFK